MRAPVVVESCVDSLDGAMASAEGGAHRLELCADLDVGGTTPAGDLIARLVAAVAIPVIVMVRPRGGSFVFTATEVDRMARDIAIAKAAGAGGIAVGALLRDGTIDVVTMRHLVQRARPLPVTCHRAFDGAADLDAALEAAIATGVARVLTSGGASSAVDGAPTLARLVARAAGRVAVIACGQVRPHNVGDLMAATGVRQLHARIIREPGPADAATRARWRSDIAAFVAATQGAGLPGTRDPGSGTR